MEKPFIPDFILENCCGSGAFGDVWKAKDMNGVPRAVKVLNKTRLKNLGVLEKEIRGLQLYRTKVPKDRHLVEIFHVGETESHIYYVMDLADNISVSTSEYIPDSMAERLKIKKRFTAEESLYLVGKMLDAVELLHKAGLAHRDIKPGNIIYIGGTPKLADIGLVTTDATGITLAGTMGFVPPERVSGAETDLYALGKLLYCVYTGKTPESFPSLSGVPADTPEGKKLNKLILKACDKNLSNRFRSAHEFKNAINKIYEQRVSAIELGLIPHFIFNKYSLAVFTAILLLYLMKIGISNLEKQVKNTRYTSTGKYFGKKDAVGRSSQPEMDAVKKKVEIKQNEISTTNKIEPERNVKGTITDNANATNVPPTTHLDPTTEVIKMNTTLQAPQKVKEQENQIPEKGDSTQVVKYSPPEIIADAKTAKSPDVMIKDDTIKTLQENQAEAKNGKGERIISNQPPTAPYSKSVDKNNTGRYMTVEEPIPLELIYSGNFEDKSGDWNKKEAYHVSSYPQVPGILFLKANAKCDIELNKVKLPNEYQLTFGIDMWGLDGSIKFAVTEVNDDTPSKSILPSRYYWELLGKQAKDSLEITFKPMMFRKQGEKDDNLVEICRPEERIEVTVNPMSYASNVMLDYSPDTKLRPASVDNFFEIRMIATRNLVKVYCQDRLCYSGQLFFKGGKFSIIASCMGENSVRIRNLRIFDIAPKSKGQAIPDEYLKIP